MLRHGCIHVRRYAGMYIRRCTLPATRQRLPETICRLAMTSRERYDAEPYREPRTWPIVTVIGGEDAPRHGDRNMAVSQGAASSEPMADRLLHLRTMLWRLPGSIRSLLLSSRRHYVPPSCSASLSSPLRILFCGSDDFSVASLRAVVDAKRRVPQLIDSVQVLHRPAKPSGRGLKTLREGRHACPCATSRPLTQYSTYQTGSC